MHCRYKDSMNFTKMHDEGAFVKRYMEDIGHYEFGSLHRPFALEGLTKLKAGHLPESPNYWRAYWITSCEYIENNRGDAVTVSSGEVCENGSGTLGPVCEKIDLGTGKQIESAAAHIRLVQYRAEKGSFNPALVRRDRGIHQQPLDM